MGLDNGIIIRKPYNELIKEVPKYVELDSWYGDRDHAEVIYFRKFWTWRDEMVSMLHMDEDNLSKTIDEEEIEMAANILKKYLNKDYYEEHGDGFGWGYEDRFEHILQNYINLLWLKDYISKNPDIEVDFYDSY